MMAKCSCPGSSRNNRNLFVVFTTYIRHLFIVWFSISTFSLYRCCITSNRNSTFLFQGKNDFKKTFALFLRCSKLLYTLLHPSVLTIHIKIQPLVYSSFVPYKLCSLYFTKLCLSQSTRSFRTKVNVSPFPLLCD